MEQGRPTKYRPGHDHRAYKAASAGFTDKEIADLFEISVSTFNKWKQDFPNFSESLKQGKDFFDAGKVENALLNRALGMKIKEVQTSLDKQGNPIQHKTKIIEKEIPPDVKACTYWLDRRLYKRWRIDNEVIIKDSRPDLTKLTDDELELFGQLLPGTQRRQMLNMERPILVQEVANILGLKLEEVGLITIDGVQSDKEDTVKPGSRLCFFPPMSGG